MIGETPPDGDGEISVAIVPSMSIMTSYTQDSYIINLTGNAPVSPEIEFPVLPVLKSLHLGIPLTPPSRMMNIPDEVFLDEGYVSDIQIEPFYETGTSNEMLDTMDEDEPVSELVIPPIVATVPEVSREPAQMERTSSERVIVEELSVDMINRMHVNQLKAELSKRGVNKSGLKTDLI